MGLRYPPELARQLLPGVRNMRESSTYQMILAEGWAEEARQMLIRLGTARLGPPDASTQAVLAPLTDPEQLERFGEQLFSATSWRQLLASDADPEA